MVVVASLEVGTTFEMRRDDIVDRRKVERRGRNTTARVCSILLVELTLLTGL